MCACRCASIKVNQKCSGKERGTGRTIKKYCGLEGRRRVKFKMQSYSVVFSLLGFCGPD